MPLVVNELGHQVAGDVADLIFFVTDNNTSEAVTLCELIPGDFGFSDCQVGVGPVGAVSFGWALVLMLRCPGGFRTVLNAKDAQWWRSGGRDIHQALDQVLADPAQIRHDDCGYGRVREHPGGAVAKPPCARM